jgi:plastocyanin
MTRRTIPALLAAAALTLALAACSSAGSSAAPASAPAASEAAPSAAAGGAACTTSSVAGTVEVAIKDFAFGPAEITAKVGDVVAFSNGDTTAHTATLDDGSCDTGHIAPGSAAGLTFSAAGTYPFHCAIHPTMKGTITVS